jgi:hypothetical protein
VSTPPIGPSRPRRGEGLLLLLLLAATWLWTAQAHWQDVDLARGPQKAWLHERVLENAARDPYQYKLWLITEALEAVRVWGGYDLETVFCANTLLALLLLVIAHQAWLRSLVDRRTAVLGGVLLAALANALFLIYYHHPYEFWGVALFCFLLRGVQRDWDWKWLALLCLVTGLVWEKHALIAPLWGLYGLQRRRPLGASLLRGLVMLVAALAVPLLVRWHLGTDRGHVDGDTPLAVQAWMKVAWFQAPYVLPFLFVLALRWRVVTPWVRWLWLYLPVLAAAYVFKSYILHEARSFWALAPVFTATFCCWWAEGGGARPSRAVMDARPGQPHGDPG